MRNIWTICRRELHSYFVSPIAWVLLALFAFLSGLFTYVFSASFIEEVMQMQMRGGQAPAISINDAVITGLFGNISVVGLFLIPLIGMRLFAEEKRQGTIELLATSPVRDIEIVIGKWLAAVLMYAAMLAVLALDMSFLFIYGKPDIKPVITGFLGVLLQGSCLLALSAFISSLTKNQIVAASLSFALSLTLWIMSWVGSLGDSTVNRVFAYISTVPHMESFARGVIDSKDLIYYLSMICLGLFLTTRSLESMRWRA